MYFISGRLCSDVGNSDSSRLQDAMLLNKRGAVVGQQIAFQALGRLVLIKIFSPQTILKVQTCFCFFAEKCKRFLQDFYTEDDNGKKVFKYGTQLVSIVFTQ